MKTVYTYFSNHFDLTWRRCWDRDTVFEGGRYSSYRRVEELCLLRNIELAEQGQGAYMVEQALTLRAFLETHPHMLPRLKRLYQQGLFEMCGAGEAIIDINMCSGETLVRNMASGVRYCKDVLEMPPLLANHSDGFGSSAQFPQVMLGCGLPGIQGMSYSYPDNQYWRGLDGSIAFVCWGVSGRGYFFDHCYQEPCRVCQNEAAETCEACHGTGFDLPQNTYPPFEPVAEDQFTDGVAIYKVESEEMLPPDNFNANLRAWEAQTPDVLYKWGTPRHTAYLWEPLAGNSEPAAEKISSRVENNPVQSGCLVSRIRIKQLARQLEAEYYCWEKAIMLTRDAGKRLNRENWRKLFLEISLAFFHDAVTGTHMDNAYHELRERITEGIRQIRVEAAACLETPYTPSNATPGCTLAVFSPLGAPQVVRATLPETEWHSVSPMVAVDASGIRHPVIYPIHAFSPVMPSVPARLINAVGANARTRPERIAPRIEFSSLKPLTWTSLRMEKAREPQEINDRVLRNEFIEVTLEDDGVANIVDLASGLTAKQNAFTLGEILIEEDEGDPWGTRKRPAFRKGLRKFTRFMGAKAFEGYQEAWYAGRYEPNIRFAREEDPKVFALEWQVTVRLIDGVRRLDFGIEIFWKSSDRRIRVAFPVQAVTDTGIYSIPAGWLRRERYEMEKNCLYSPNGDWPALHFVACEPDASGHAWAVVNHGTPSARIEDGNILMSVLRSPGFGHCLERYGQTYPMPTSGIRDGGWHYFEFQLVPFGGDAELPALALQSAALNQTAPCLVGDDLGDLQAAGLHLEGDDVELLAVKPSFDPEQKDAIVVRILNQADQDRAVCLHLPDMFKTVRECNMIEESGEKLNLDGQNVSLQLKPFEIRSLFCCR